MSVVRGYGLNGKSIYMNVAKPEYTWVQFTVNSTDTGGLGVTSVKSNGYVESVFMHTSATPGSVNGFTNPNPSAGYALLRFKNAFNYWLGGYNVQYPPATSTSTTSTTANSVYIITGLGTATLAQWQAVGLPQGLTPTVGQVFVATASQSIGGSATVGVPGVPVAPIISVVGQANTTITNSNIAQNAGAQLMLQFASPSLTMNSYTPAGTNSAPALTMNSYTPAGTITNGTPDTFAGTPAVLTGSVAAPTFTGSAATLTGTVSYAASSPANSTVVYLCFCYDASSVTIDGI